MTLINKAHAHGFPASRESDFSQGKQVWADPNCFRIAVMESRLLDILVCPLCKGRLEHDRQQAELVCRADRLAFPIRDGIPVMLESEARVLDETVSS